MTQAKSDKSLGCVSFKEKTLLITILISNIKILFVVCTLHDLFSYVFIQISLPFLLLVCAFCVSVLAQYIEVCIINFSSTVELHYTAGEEEEVAFK